MSKLTLKVLDTRIDEIESKLGLILDAIQGAKAQQAPQPSAPVAVAPAPQAAGSVPALESDPSFASKFSTQLAKVLRKAPAEGKTYRLAAVPNKQGGMSCWFVGAERRIPARGLELLSVSPTGDVTEAVKGVRAWAKAHAA